jgi:regulatory protein
MTPSKEKPGQAKRKVKKPRKITPTYLENAGLHYLQRYATSVANFRQVMTRKVLRSAKVHGTDVQEGKKLIESLIERYVRSGLLNDKTFSEVKVKTLRQRGTSKRQISQKLMAKGLGKESITSALTEVDDEDSELKAAIRFAERRRLGPHRKTKMTPEQRQKDLAAMMRAGFSFDLAKRVINKID